MDSQKSYFFTVLTYPGGITESIQNALLLFCKNKFTEYVVVKEYGKSTLNAHLNIVYRLPEALDVTNWSKNCHKYFKQCYLNEILPEETSRLIKNKKCTSPENVIGGYLQKEAKAEILINQGFDIESMKILANENRKKVSINMYNAPDIIYTYMKEEFMITGNPDLSSWIFIIQSMLKDEYKIPVNVIEKLHIIKQVIALKYFNDPEIIINKYSEQEILEYKKQINQINK